MPNQIATPEGKTYVDFTVAKTFSSCTIPLGELKVLIERLEEGRVDNEDSAVMQVYPPRGERSECRLALVSRGHQE